MSNYYAELIKKRKQLLPIILDSGVSTELERRGAKMRNGQWSGCVAIDDYEKLVETHIAYIKAGADIITVNSYASSRLMLEPAGLGNEVQQINRLNISAAIEARKKPERMCPLLAQYLTCFHLLTGLKEQSSNLIFHLKS